MPIKTTKLKDILTREQVYPETNVASIVDFDENIAINEETSSGDPYATSLTFKGVTYKVAGDTSKDLEEEIARAKAKEAELQEYIAYLYRKLDLELGSDLVAEDEEGNADSVTAIDENGEQVPLIVDLHI